MNSPRTRFHLIRQTGRILPAALIMATLLTAAAPPAGAKSTTPAPGSPSPAAPSAGAEFGVTLGTEYGFGGMIRMGMPTAAVEIGAGIMPLISFVTVTGFSATKSYFNVYTPTSFGAKLHLGAGGVSSEDGMGFEFGVTHNTLIKTGFGGGINYLTGGRPRLVLSAGAMIYPQAKDELRAKLNADEHLTLTDAEFSAPLAAFQPYLGVSILFGTSR